MAVEMIGGPRLCEPLLATGLGRFTGAASRHANGPRKRPSPARRAGACGPTLGGYRRDHLRALAQRVEVDATEVRIMGSKSALLRTLVAASSAKTAGLECPVCTEMARHGR